jgi:hypothetical protein
MTPNEVYKSFGLIAVAITWVGIAFLVRRWPSDKSMSISKHAAAHKSAYLMMLVMEALTLSLFFLFVLKWLSPTLGLPTFFTVCVGLASLGLFIGAVIPDTKGWRSTVHQLAGYGAGMLFIPASTVLYLSPNISSFARGFALITLVYELASVTLLTVSQRAKDNHLYLQVAYILFFDLSLLAAAYIR